MRIFGLLCGVVLVGAVKVQVPFVNQAVSFGNDLIGSPDSWTWEDCGTAEDLVEVKSIQLSPDPPVRGQDLTITASGTVKETIEDGAYAKAVVKLGLIKLLTKEFDICQEAKNAELDIQCPVQSGDYTVSHTVTIPKEAPPGKFGIDVSAFTVDDDDLLCLKLHVDWKIHV